MSDLPPNVRRLRPRAEDYTPYALSVLFAKLSTAIAQHQLGWEPEAAAVVLISHGKLRIFHSGFPTKELFDDATRALEDYRRYQTELVYWPDTPKMVTTPQQARRKRRQWARRQETAVQHDLEQHPHLCWNCRQARFTTARGLKQHLVSCLKREPPSDYTTAVSAPPDALPTLRLV
jgi:hypothetical protein